MRSIPSQWLKFSLLCAATLLGGLEDLWGLGAQAQATSSGSANLAVVRPVMECGDLIWMGQKLSLMAGVPLQVQSATVATDAPAPYCDVKGYVSPMVDFEVRLPTTTWTQRFLQVGCGAFCGTLAIQVPNTEMVGNAQIGRGELALASTDTGHPTNDGLDGTWLAADPQLRVDFAYRGVHVTAVAAKALIRMFYGQGPKLSYFMGISEGGREAAMESQRYPEDFDGIVCGAPAVNFLTQITIYHAWNILSNSDKEGHIILTPDKLPILHAAALAACDANDGLKDGLISDPWNCHVDPTVVQCKEGQDQTTCLTPVQVHAAQLIYQGAQDSKGQPLVFSGPLPGSELQWINAGFVAAVPDRSRTISARLATFSIKYMAFPQNLPLDYDISDFHFDEATFREQTPMHALYDALDPDLSRFDRAGHKIIFWAGLADGSIPPANLVAYYEGMQSYMGKERAQRFTRLYLFPGGYHANGNPGPIDCDLLTAIISWVEQGKAPYRLVSYYLPFVAQKGGRYGPYGDVLDTSKSYRSRPVYPYPEVAHYKGSGSIDEAANFDAGVPAAKHPEFRWIGLPSFLTPVHPLWCGWTGMTFSCGTQQR